MRTAPGNPGVPAAFALRAALVTILLAVLAPAGCGGSPCKKACRKIKKCFGIKDDMGVLKEAGPPPSTPQSSWTCPLDTEQCSPRAACDAACYLDTRCEGITGKNSEAASQLQQCLQDCASRSWDGGAGDGGPATEGGVPVQHDTGPSHQKDSGLPCEPDCDGKECGPDGCGGQCGECPTDHICDPHLARCFHS